MVKVILIIFLAVALHRIFNSLKVSAGPYRHLTKPDVAFLNGAGEAMFPAGGDIEASYEQAGMIAWIDDYYSWNTPFSRLLMRALFFMFEHATIIFLFTYKRFSQLTPSARVDYLESWELSEIYLRRMLYQSLRAILCMAYCQSPKVEKDMGYFRPENCEKNAQELLK